MENITLGQISNWITLVIGLGVGIVTIYRSLKKLILKTLENEFADINKKLDDLGDRLNTVDVETCKNFLVARLAELDKGQIMDEVEIERFYEQYDHYKEKGGNSYIKRKVDAMEAEGKLIRRAQ